MFILEIERNQRDSCNDERAVDHSSSSTEDKFGRSFEINANTCEATNWTRQSQNYCLCRWSYSEGIIIIKYFLITKFVSLGNGPLRFMQIFHILKKNGIINNNIIVIILLWKLKN